MKNNLVSVEEVKIEKRIIAAYWDKAYLRVILEMGESGLFFDRAEITSMFGKSTATILSLDMLEMLYNAMGEAIIKAKELLELG